MYVTTSNNVKTDENNVKIPQYVKTVVNYNKIPRKNSELPKTMSKLLKNMSTAENVDKTLRKQCQNYQKLSKIDDKHVTPGLSQLTKNYVIPAKNNGKKLKIVTKFQKIILWITVKNTSSRVQGKVFFFYVRVS